MEGGTGTERKGWSVQVNPQFKHKNTQIHVNSNPPNYKTQNPLYAHGRAVLRLGVSLHLAKLVRRGLPAPVPAPRDERVARPVVRLLVVQAVVDRVAVHLFFGVLGGLSCLSVIDDWWASRTHTERDCCHTDLGDRVLAQPPLLPPPTVTAVPPTQCPRRQSHDDQPAACPRQQPPARPRHIAWSLGRSRVEYPP